MSELITPNLFMVSITHLTAQNILGFNIEEENYGKNLYTTSENLSSTTSILRREDIWHILTFT